MTAQEKFNKRMKLRCTKPKMHIYIEKGQFSALSNTSGNTIIKKLKTHPRIGKMAGQIK